MEERRKLVEKWSSGLYTISELAKEFGVTRPTVYEWTRRYEEEGAAGLVDRPPVPKTCPHRTEEAIGERIIAAKEAYPDWGPAKLVQILGEDHPEVDWPAASTAGRILDAAGLVRKRRARRRQLVSPYAKRLEAKESGEMMTADHKGQIRLQNGAYCYPVTIADPVSRYIYAVDGKTSTSLAEAKQSFVRVFKEYGLPQFIGTDNGNPFACSRSLGGLSQLSVWWVELGVVPVKIHKGCPWENGIHERMHRSLKASTARPPAATMRGQQARFDRFRSEFNSVRPHEGLDGRRPAELLTKCARSYPSRVDPVEYPAHYETRMVTRRGEMKWKGQLPYVGQSFLGKRIGLVEIDDGIWSVHFSTIEIGRFDERTQRIY
jgi:transposase InsO family protein